MTTNKDFWDNTLEHCSEDDRAYIASKVCGGLLDKISAEIEHEKGRWDDTSSDTCFDIALEVVERYKKAVRDK